MSQVGRIALSSLPPDDDDSAAARTALGLRGAVTLEQRPANVDAVALYDTVYRQMFALAGGRHGDLEDLVQIAALEAMRGYSSFEGRCALSTWTYRICYRTLIRHDRWYRRWLARFSWSKEGDLPDIADAEPTAADRLEEQERVERLHRALARLSPKRRAVVVLRDFEALGIPEIAQIVNAAEHTVRSRLRDGRKDLLEALRDDPYFGDRFDSANGGEP